MAGNRRSVGVVGVLGLSLVFGGVAQASRAAPASDLYAALTALMVAKRQPLLFDRRIVEHLKSGAYRPDLPIDKALAVLLQGTGLVAVRTSAGAYVITKALAVVTPAVYFKPPAVEAIPDILVVGHATDNFDLPRSEDDIQPYQVLSSNRVDLSLDRTAGDLLFEQVTSNLASPDDLNQFRQVTSYPSFGSNVELNGLGSDQTLVTVDGHRMPGMPGFEVFPQADISALSPSAIDRVETLGTTAGAIFGVGATGGALNVVLKHDYRGIELNIVNGISQRGDDAEHVFEAKAGFETPDGRTKGMILVGYGDFGGDLVGARAVGTARLALAQQLDPEDYADYATANAVVFTNENYGNLKFTKAYGGASLGAATTYLPLDAPALNAGGLGLLAANAGKAVSGLSYDGAGALQSLQPETRTLSITSDLRQAIGDSVEVFADVIVLRDTTHVQNAAVYAETELSKGDPGNPFKNDVDVTYPIPGLVGRETEHHDTDRETVGAIFHLGHGWSGDVDFSTGKAILLSKNFDALYSDTDIDVFSGAASLASQLSQFTLQPSTLEYGRDRLYDANLRLGGSLVNLPGGPWTLSATGEWYGNRTSDFFVAEYYPGGEFDSTELPQREATLSAYLETHLPLLPRDHGFFLSRGLKLQLAARFDRYTIENSNEATYLENARTFEVTSSVVSFTAGLGIEPVKGVMLRASYAVGYAPPEPTEISYGSGQAPLYDICDPKRGGCDTPDSGTYEWVDGGSVTGKAQRSQTISFGIVLKPAIAPGFRASFDYDRLLITDALTDFAEGDPDYFLENEAEYPGRVIRAPLTAADAALGYTAGKIEEINTTILNIGRDLAETFNASASYTHGFAHFAANIYGNVTWEPKFTMRTDPALGAPNLVGTLDGPIGIRATGGANLASGPWVASATARYYGPYSTAFLDDTGAFSDDPVQKIPGKAYLDLSFGYTLPAKFGRRSVPIRYHLAIRNVLDVQPTPVVADGLTGSIADPYSDFLGRRFEIGVSTKL